MCECKVGPGKFEGESALTFLAYQSMLNGFSDESIGAVDFFKAPLGFDADPEAIKAAREYGYCEACIAEALAERPYGMAISEDSQGFVWGELYATAKAYDKAVSQAEAVDEEGSDDDA